MIKRIFITFIILTFASVTAASADTANVGNNISVTATSGGNSASSVRSGTAKTEIHVRTEINGSSSAIDIATTSASGSLHIVVTSTFRSRLAPEVATGTATSVTPAAEVNRFDFVASIRIFFGNIIGWIFKH